MIRKIFQLVFVGLLSLQAFGTEETYTVRRQADAFGTSPFSFQVIDGRFDDVLDDLFLDKSTDLIVKFGIDEDITYGYIEDYEMTLGISVQGYAADGSLYSTETADLTISYDPAGGVVTTDMSFFKTSGAYRYIISVDGTSDPIPDNIYIEGELTIDRYYDFDETVVPTVVGSNYLYYNSTTNLEATVYDVNNLTIPSVGQELEIWWDFIEGAEEYELEWTWVDNYHPSSLTTGLSANLIDFDERDFELNNSRIITSDQRYRIPLIYAEGYLIYRVRGIGRFTDAGLDDVHIRKFGAWSSDAASSISTVANWPHFVRIGTLHEALKNWQYQAVYAEEGKKKEIVSYFDGSLRNRQTVTRINSNKEAIAGESIYDNQGRAAIQVLPAPVGNSALKYYQQLNLNGSDDPFSHSDFDWEPVSGLGSCFPEPALMSDESGASKYYSDNNSVENNWQDYVPDAAGFPYVQTEYTPDNTGRIRQQSGVGEDYKMNSSHATRYYYLQPFQEELDRLFGYQVGYKTRYKKNLVVDANGQVSVSYLDPQGRVIATALAGDNSTGGDAGNPTLGSLDEEVNGNHVSVTNDLLNKLDPTDEDTDLDDNLLFNTGELGPFNDALNFNTQITPTDEGTNYDFTYEVTTGVFSELCEEPDPDWTADYPFAYILSIDLKDDCGNSILVNGPMDVSLAGTPGTEYVGSTGGTYTYNTMNATLDIDAHTLSKVIRVDPAMLETYVTHFIENNPCLLTLDDFYEDNTDCFDNLPAEDTDLNSTNFDIYRNTLLGDVSPMGQYGEVDGSDPLSVFLNPNYLNKGTSETNYNWEYPLDETGAADDYYEEDGTTVSTFVDEDGEIIDASDATDVDLFVSNWQPEWAEKLLPYHPEYCYLEYAEEIWVTETATAGTTTGVSSDAYNNFLQGITTYADARSTSNAFGTDLISSNAFDDPSTTMPVIKDEDPYFAIDYDVIDDATVIGSVGTGNTLKEDLMMAVMSDYKGSGWTMWKYAVVTVMCGTDISEGCESSVPTTVASLESSLTVEEEDMVWATYKQAYIAEKKKVDQLFMDMHAIRGGCYNDYIGTASPSIPSMMPFIYYPEYLLPGTYSDPTIIELFAEAISTVSSTSEFPWAAGPFSFLFADKEKRFIPIHDLYDPTVPEAVAMDILAEESNASIYEATGRCDLSYDVEYFLSAMAATDNLAPSSSVNSGDMPQFTTDLYLDLGGLTPTSPPGTAVTISSSAISGGISLTSTSAVGTPPMGTIELDEPSTSEVSGWGTTVDWDDVESMEMLYYIPGSYSSPNYDFEILALIDDDNDAGTPAIEVVLTGQTTVAIGECSYEPTCERAENLGDNLIALYVEVLADWPSGGAVSEDISDFVGGWYEESELYTQLEDFSIGATVTTNSGSTEMTISSPTREIEVDFTTPITALEFITGATFNPSTAILTVHYVNTSGVEAEAYANVDYFLLYTGGSSTLEFDLDCGCAIASQTDEEDAELAFKDLLNALLVPSISYPLAYSAEIEEMAQYLGFSALFQIDTYVAGTAPNELLTTTHFSFNMEDTYDGSCPVDFIHDTGSSGDLTTLETILTVDFVEVSPGVYDIYLTGVLSDDDTVYLVSNFTFSCLHFEECTNCVPLTVAPLSCNEAWDDYTTEISSLNATLSSAGETDLFPTYDEADFCEGNLKYMVASYLHYLTTFEITDPDDEQYVSLALFSVTDLNFGYDDPVSGDDMSDVVDDYDSYLVNNPDISWNDYVNDVYLEASTVCPPSYLPFDMDLTIDYPCDLWTSTVDTVNAKEQYDIYLENVIDNFKQRYIEEAIGSLVETFTETHDDKEYHYTLYYYDQAGNLTQTVPPAGVDRIETDLISSQGDVDDAREVNTTPDNGTLPGVLPEHSLQTNYKYNSLNQLVEQTTPDGGTSHFAYDELGRLVVSQNAKQKAYPTAGYEQFSYTRYDGLGRIIEVGEMTLPDGYYFDENGKMLDDTDELVDVSAVDFPLALTSVTLEEVTVTVYDEQLPTAVSFFDDFSEDNQRNRIMAVLYFDEYDDATTFSDHENGTFYDYDVHGNVKELIQVNLNTLLVSTGQHIKKIKYEYDLVSGNVKEVFYQEDEDDQFIHEYEYDADNRITNVRTSEDKTVWEQDAKYFYYDHGPLARTELGDKKVQAIDHAYTVQGWLKGVNSESLETDLDQGKDGEGATMNEMVARDVFGYSLHYFSDDYSARFGNDFLSYSSSAVVNPKNLYNGNIKEMYTAGMDINESDIGTSRTWYEYDQLNRIVDMEQKIYTGGSGSAVLSGVLARADYSYDANGNLETLNRWMDNGSSVSTKIDEFTYNYTAGTNQLTHVDDVISSGVIGVDLDDQAADNYTYNEIGELIGDDQENIDEISWKVTGKVESISYSSGSIEQIDFNYDAMGNRIEKKVTYVASGGSQPVLTTAYVRDAQGNVMSIYNLEEDVLNENVRIVKLGERNIYGSSRVAVEQINQFINPSDSPLLEPDFEQTVGDKTFELSNHLGNVLQVVTDRKVAVESGTPGNVDYYIADVVTQNDYYPFGMLLPNRNESTPEYRYGFNGKEDDLETYGNGNIYDYGFRIYNPRIGKFLSRDPLSGEYPFYTPYQFAGNKPIWAIDIDGLEEWIYTYEFDAKSKTATLISKEHNIEVKQRMRKSYEGGAPRSETINKTTGEKMKNMEAGTTTSEMGTVQYRYVDKDGNEMNLRKNYNGDYVEGSNEVMPKGQNNFFSSIYIGPTNPSVVVDGEVFPDYRREPLNELDLAAYNHDKAYDDKEAAGADGAFNDLSVLSADQKLARDAHKIIKKYETNQKDSKTNRPVTDHTYNSAKLVAFLFDYISHKKSQTQKNERDVKLFQDKEYMNTSGWSRIVTGQAY